MKICFIGDTHGNGPFLDKICKIASDHGCKVLYQLGDFGYFPHTDWGQKFLKQLSYSLLLNDQELYFLDGNHDNHPLLFEAPDRGDGFRFIRDRIFYSPRGHRWTWDGIRFMSLGGAYSIDKDPNPTYGWKGRTEGWNWWPEEMITVEQMDKAANRGPIDVLLSHDLPTKANIPNLRNKDEYPATNINRARLQYVVDQTRPGLVLTGHWHDCFQSYIDYPYAVEGGLDWHRVLCHTLAHDGASRGGYIAGTYAIVDTDEIPLGADRGHLTTN